MRYIKNDKYLRLLFSLSFVVLLVCAVAVLLYFRQRTDPLLIYISPYASKDIVGGIYDVLGIVGYAGLGVFINAILADFIYNRERFASFVLASCSIICACVAAGIVSVVIATN